MGVCLVAGILISAKGGCLSGPSEWKKEEVKKDGLDVYKYVDISTFHSKIKRQNYYDIRCPICNSYARKSKNRTGGRNRQKSF